MTTTTTNRRNRRVLILDDSALILEATRDALEMAGFDVSVAHNLWEFEQKCRREHDLILIDVQMPEAFGDDLAMLLRQGRAMRTRIYLLSSLSDKELEQRATDAEIDGYISKRAGLDALVEKVTQILATEPGS